MNIDELAKHLADKSRIGLTDALCEKLDLDSTAVTRARLSAQITEGRGHLQVLFLACFVVDDTDFFSDGEIYWWSIPAVVEADGKVSRNNTYGLPNGMDPHKCGDQEWMTNLSLSDPPLWAVIPPGDDAESCVIRLGIYDDDREPADLPGAMTEGLEALAGMSTEPLSGPTQIIGPVRDAIFKHLKAEQDDILIDQDLIIRRGEVARFGVGMVGSVINSMVRAYYFVRDTERTQQFGPITLHKGETAQVQFDVPMKQGGRLALFARGHDVGCPSFGVLTVDMPFFNRVLSSRQEADLEGGFPVTGNGPAKFIAFYTAPDAD